MEEWVRGEKQENRNSPQRHSTAQGGTNGKGWIIGDGPQEEAHRTEERPNQSPTKHNANGGRGSYT